MQIALENPRAMTCWVCALLRLEMMNCRHTVITQATHSFPLEDNQPIPKTDLPNIPESTARLVIRITALEK
jgi:hypothetical protein